MRKFGTRRKIIGRVLGGLAASALALMAGPVATPGIAFASPPTPAAWIGSPLQATWPNADGCEGAGGQYPSATCSLPSAHHIVYLQAGGETGDWAADLQNVSAYELMCRSVYEVICR